jgi:hypothetical protein
VSWIIISRIPKSDNRAFVAETFVWPASWECLGPRLVEGTREALFREITYTLLYRIQAQREES